MEAFDGVCQLRAHGPSNPRPVRVQAQIVQAQMTVERERAGMLALDLTRARDRTPMNPASRAGERSQRSRPPSGALLARTQDQLAVFRDRELGRELGTCSCCGKVVRSQQDFIREHGSVIHVRCHTGGSATSLPRNEPSDHAAV
jgi:hypothetical protein